MAEQSLPVLDVQFEVVRGPLKQGDRHPKRRSWIFTGYYDRRGDPLFYSNLYDARWYMRIVSRLLWTLISAIGALMVLALIGALISGFFRGHW